MGLTRRAFVAGGAAAAVTLVLGSCRTAEQVIEQRLTSAEEAARLALGMARQADDADSFGVGGVLIENSTGRVVKQLPNRVMRHLDDAGPNSHVLMTSDPTAHGERQLISWYYAQRAADGLPAPKDMTLVTTLDPCCMCAGCILSSGFNVGVVAYDTYAGINYTLDFSFTDLPPALRNKARATFGYYEIAGQRPYVGSPGVAFSRTAVTEPTAAECSRVFAKSADEVRAESSGSGQSPANLQDPARSPAGAAVRRAFQSEFPDAFALKLENYRRPTARVHTMLKALRDTTPGATNAVAYIDPFGNLLLASADTFSVSPIATAFMNVTQAYARIRFNLMNSTVTFNAAQSTLTSPKYGTFVFLSEPDTAVPQTIADLGAFGSTMEGPIPVREPSNFQYFDSVASSPTLAELVSTLPPLYSQLIGINPQKVS